MSGYGGGYGGRGGGGGGGGRGGGRGGGGGRGRGAYYKAKYGGGGRGRGRGGGGGGGRGDGGGGSYGGSSPSAASPSASPAPSSARHRGSIEDLETLLRSIEGAPYPAYKQILGSWEGVARPAPAAGGATSAGVPFTFTVDHVQGDAYAAPSRCHVTVDAGAAGFPPSLAVSHTRRVAAADFVCRRFHDAVSAKGIDRAMSGGGGGWHGAKGGDLRIEQCSQHILERTACSLRGSTLEARFTVALPARGRSVCGKYAAEVIGLHLPDVVGRAMIHASLDAASLKSHVQSAEDQECLRAALGPAGLAAFVREGAILPRASGASDAPMEGSSAVLFRSPASLRRTVRLPHAGAVTGMAVPRGVTLICGGGFHGKSTLLQALQVGVYNHVPGDGRELVASSSNAVKIRAEDGRSVSSVDIGAFIQNLPGGRSTADFSTADASGSTSQAANIVESLEAGADLLLIDEDSSATNFMIRDARMSRLIAPDKEPITPFIARARELWERFGVSTIVVVGGAGDYFAVADLVIAIDEYVPADATARAKAIIEETGGAAAVLSDAGGRSAAGGSGAKPLALPTNRSPAGGFALEGKTHVRDMHRVTGFESLALDLTGVEQLVEIGQTRAIVEALSVLTAGGLGATPRGAGGASSRSSSPSMSEVLDTAERMLDERGVDAFKPGWFHNGLTRPRRFELAAAVNRVRSGRFKQLGVPSERAAGAAPAGSTLTPATPAPVAVWLDE
ncbi:hypothetical protein FNF31_01136 [Cafeteria roenbergensis]|uniref:Uncharacterized protein n=1 Tax=Cafeteria roenbergensis TaxID=33653 RepID=A0A5A8DBX7_CAFRO|nr:hypothetical protein FNF28_04521 [Cafeteria roenbergensis]KAA0166761.1 hypothetical protein FNF31_01136 [Cafeteria roenbergensis]